MIKKNSRSYSWKCLLGQTDAVKPYPQIPIQSDVGPPCKPLSREWSFLGFGDED